ncbi:MAG: DUF72 domain-containing protein [Dehalococcoidia bacterium]|nr:DUF72 domain-containing protein [Dehalococcoidia bacterium]
MPKKDWLLYYAREFITCEINATYYTLLKSAVMESMASKTGDGFLFSVKANKQMTHERENNIEVFKVFREMLGPLIERGKMGCVLAQFPNSFKFNARNRDYVEGFRERMGDLPVVIEFRNAGWLREDVFGWLSRYELGFCCVDEPPLPNLLPSIAEVTGKIAYVRFHGRNKEKWWQHEHAYERYDYTYSPEELEEWIPKIRKLDQTAEKTFVFANNHWRGQAVSTIRQLRMMLD